MRRIYGPAVAAGTAGSMAAVFDAMFLGHTMGIKGLAALAVAVPILLFVNAFGIWVNSGVASKVAMYYTNGEKKEASRVMVNNVIVNFLTSIVVCVFAYLVFIPVMHHSATPYEIVQYSEDYLRIFLLGVFFTYSSNGLYSILRTIGHPKESMSMQILVAAIHIILDVVFIFKLGLGVRGAALATVLSQAMAWVLLILRFCIRRTDLQIRRSSFALDMEYIRFEFRFGSAPFYSDICAVLIAVHLNEALVNSSLEAASMYLACYAIYRCLSEVFLRMLSGLTSSIIPLFVVNVSKKHYTRVKVILVKSIILGSVIMSVGYLFLCSSPLVIAQMFNLDSEMKDICAVAIRIGLCTLPFLGGQMVALSFFHSVEKKGLILGINLSRQLLVLAPLLFILPYAYGPVGVWWSLCLTDIVSIVYSWYALLSEVRKLGVE